MTNVVMSCRARKILEEGLKTEGIARVVFRSTTSFANFRKQYSASLVIWDYDYGHALLPLPPHGVELLRRKANRLIHVAGISLPPF